MILFESSRTPPLLQLSSRFLDAHGVTSAEFAHTIRTRASTQVVSRRLICPEVEAGQGCDLSKAPFSWKLCWKYCLIIAIIMVNNGWYIIMVKTCLNPWNHDELNMNCTYSTEWCTLGIAYICAGLCCTWFGSVLYMQLGAYTCLRTCISTCFVCASMHLCTWSVL